jgi:hypothetical protein
VEFPRRPRLEIFAESNTTFFVKGEEMQLTFVRDASGAVTQMILAQIGSQIKGKKVK